MITHTCYTYTDVTHFAIHIDYMSGLTCFPFSYADMAEVPSFFSRKKPNLGEDASLKPGSSKKGASFLAPQKQLIKPDTVVEETRQARNIIPPSLLAWPLGFLAILAIRLFLMRN